MHIVYPLSRETRRDLLPLLLEIEDDGQEPLNACCGDVVAVGALNKWFALEVEDGDQAGHENPASSKIVVDTSTSMAS